MKKITTLLMLCVLTFSQAQLFSSIRDNSGHTSNSGYASHIGNRTVTDWLHYDNGTNATSFGTQNPHTLGVYIKLTSILLAPYINRQIEELKFYLGPDANNISGNITVEIYTDPTASPVYTEDFPMSGLTAGDWNTVTLSTPYVIDGSEFYIGYKFTAPGYIIGVDDGSNFVSNVNFYTFDNGPMTNWDNVTTKNFNLQAGVGGALANNDAGISTLNLPDYFITGNTDIEATITNYGSNILNSIDFNYQIDNGTVQTDHLTGLNLASGQSITVTHSVPWNATPGSHSIDVYTSNFNGNGDDDIPANDHFVKSVLVLNEAFTKNVVYEEATGTWCGWCVRGIVGLKNMYHYYDDGTFIGIAVHDGDPMEVNEYDSNMNVSGYPSGLIDRKSGEVDPDYSTLEAAYLTEKDKLPVAKIEITNQSWNANSRELTVEVASTFALDIANADYNVSLIIVEDNVTGTSNGYAQHNYYSGNYDLVDWEGINYRNLPDPIPANDMVYNHVGRALVGGYHGVAGNIPSSVSYNTPYSYTFNYTMPSYINENNVNLVAIIIDNATGEIVNGIEVKLNVTNDIDELSQNFHIQIYPNPSKGNLFISRAEESDIMIFNINGGLVYQKTGLSQDENIHLNLANGVYLIKFVKGDKVTVRKIVITK